jgi:DNA-binding NarL/FixJ family response regulator
MSSPNRLAGDHEYLMNSTTRNTVSSILILKADRICADALALLTAKLFPHATIRVVLSIARARQALLAEPVELMVTGLGMSLGGDPLEFLAEFAGTSGRARQVLVVTSHHELRLLTGLRMLPIRGAFDSTGEDAEQLAVALQTVAGGDFYWSRSLLDRMSADATASHARMLTTSEQLVLSVLGSGVDNASAARELGLSTGTVASVRRDLHRKLGVQHRGELMRMAAQNGFVQFTPFGIVRPGYTLLTAAHQARKSKRALNAA